MIIKHEQDLLYAVIGTVADPTECERAWGVVKREAELLTIDQLIKRHARQVLALHEGNKTHAARALGISRRSLYRWLRE